MDEKLRQKTHLIINLIDSTFHFVGLYLVVIGYFRHDPFKLALGGIFFIESTMSHIYNLLYFKDK
jgi:hypothetical protein